MIRFYDNFETFEILNNYKKIRICYYHKHLKKVFVTNFSDKIVYVNKNYNLINKKII